MQKGAKKFDFTIRYTLTAIRSAGGFSLIEIMLGVGVFALLVTGIVGALVFSQHAKLVASQREQALRIAEEGIEAARNIRDESYSAVATGDNGLSTTSVRWNFSGTTDVIDALYTRIVTVAQVDNMRKNIIAEVTWPITDSRQGSVSLRSRLTNWRRQTSAGGAPTLFCTYDLTAANSGSNVTDAISIAYKSPYVYLARASSPGSEFFVFDVSNPAAPVLVGQLGLSGNPNDLSALGNYVYIASSDNTQELQVIDISLASVPLLAATFDLTAANSGQGTVDGVSAVAASSIGDYLYFMRAESGGKELIVFNITTPTLPTIAGTLDITGGVEETAHQGNYLYAATADDSAELQVIDVTAPASPSLVGTLNLVSGNDALDGKSIAANVNTVFLGRKGSSLAPEFYVIDATTPSSPTLTSTLDVGTLSLNSLDYATTTQLVFLVANSPTENDYYAIDVADLSNPALLTNLALIGVPAKLVYGPQADKVFIASGADTEELECVAP